MIDAQPGDDGWIVPLAVTAALFDDPEAAETAYRAVKPLAERRRSRPAPRNPLWPTRPAHGLADPELREAAVVCFAAALEALPRLGAATRSRDAVAAYTDRYVIRGRCPADDLLDRLHGTDGGDEAIVREDSAHDRPRHRTRTRSGSARSRRCSPPATGPRCSPTASRSPTSPHSTRR